MAGELEHIIPTSPGEGTPARRTRNINFVDTNGVLRSITHVYWSPTNNPNDVKLIWQRDHSPVGDTYKTVLQAGDKDSGTYTAIKFTAIDTFISTIKIWSMIEGNHYITRKIYVYNEDGTFFTAINSDANDYVVSTETLNVDGQDKTVYNILLSNLNNIGLTGLTPGNKYYLFVNNFDYGNLWTPIFYNTGNGNYYYQIGYNNYWKLGSSQYNLTECLTNTGTDKPKFEVNGVQV